MAAHVAHQAPARARRSAAPGSEPILAAKITTPDVPHWAVQRPRVTRLIAEGASRCPLTVVDLGQIAVSERNRVSAIDRQLAHIAAELPPSTLLLVTAPGAAAGAEQGQTPDGPPRGPR